MQESAPAHDPILEAAWYVRQQYWQRKLGRLRLGVEPIEQQLAKYRRVTWVLTALPVLFALIFVALFAAFEHPLVGLVLVLILCVPIILLAWLDYGILCLRAGRYRAELLEYERRQSTPGRT